MFLKFLLPLTALLLSACTPEVFSPFYGMSLEEYAQSEHARPLAYTKPATVCISFDGVPENGHFVAEAQVTADTGGCRTLLGETGSVRISPHEATIRFDVQFDILDQARARPMVWGCPAVETPAGSFAFDLRGVPPGSYTVYLQDELVGQMTFDFRVPPFEPICFSTNQHPRATATPQPILESGPAYFPSPDQAWTAVIGDGGLRLEDVAGTLHEIFPPGSTIASVAWSPDSVRLLALQSNLAPIEPAGSGFEVTGPLAIWSITIDDPTPRQLTELPESAEFPSQLQWGKWSPDGRYIVFWSGALGASVLADGLPLAVLDSSTGAIYSAGGYSLYTLDYHDWSPDSSRLAVTLGSGREAWRAKALAIVDLAAGTTTPVAAAADQIPGRVAWSPGGSRIAYAANPAETADLEPSTITFDNPGIAARRIYLLDAATGEARRLDDVGSFQDAPVWNTDGSVLYYIQRVDDRLQLMAADPVTGEATPVEGASEPLPDLAGYYGLFDWNNLLQQIPD